MRKLDFFKKIFLEKKGNIPSFILGFLGCGGCFAVLAIGFFVIFASMGSLTGQKPSISETLSTTQETLIKGGKLCSDLQSLEELERQVKEGKLKKEEKYLLITRYYSPVSGQSEYFHGSYEADKKINCGEGSCLDTADGTQVCFGVIAADKTFYPFGTAIYIPGISEKFFGGKAGVVHDTGGAIKGSHIDVWMGIGEEGLLNVKNSPTDPLYQKKVVDDDGNIKIYTKCIIYTKINKGT